MAANPSVSDPLVKRKLAGNIASERFADGVYYWRVTAVNNTTKKVESSETRKFSITTSKPVQLITPANNSVIKYHDANPMINFMWSRNESVFPLYPDGICLARHAKPVISSAVVGNKISLNTLGKGTYYWKITTVNESDQVNLSGRVARVPVRHIAYGQSSSRRNP